MTPAELSALRLSAYRRLYFEDATMDDSVQALHEAWKEAEEGIAACRRQLRGATTAEEKAGLLLTLLVLQQVAPRDFALLDETMDKAVALLPEVRDDSLRARLLVHLAAETEDEEYLTEARQLLGKKTTAIRTSEEYWYILLTLQGIENQEMNRK